MAPPIPLIDKHKLHIMWSKASMQMDCAAGARAVPKQLFANNLGKPADVIYI
jgi:hypothetical protein